MIIVLFYILCILLVLLILFRLLENKKAKQICRVLDRLLVDIALRGIVENYDRRHNKNKKNVVDETENQVHNELERLQFMIKTLLGEKKALNEALEQCEQAKEVLSNEKEELIETNEFFASSIEDLQNTIKTLSFEQNTKIVNKIPNKVNEKIEQTKDSYLYAEPDATGTILRKISPKETKYSLFRLELLNEQVCKFYVLKLKDSKAEQAEFFLKEFDNETAKAIIEGRQMHLVPACDIESSASPQKIILMKPGMAEKQGNSWFVKSKAQIRLVNA